MNERPLSIIPAESGTTTTTRRDRSALALWLAVLVIGFATSRIVAWRGWIDAERLGAAGGPTTLALDEASGRVFVGLWNDERVVVTDEPGTIRGDTVVRDHRPAALAFSARDRTLFFVCYSRDHVCAVRDGAAHAHEAADCFCPGGGAPDERRWLRCEARHSPFTVPEGRLEGQVETLALDEASGKLVTIAGHIGSGVGFHKDFAWVTALGWDGHELATSEPGVDLIGTYHDHNPLPLGLPHGAAGPLWLLRPSSASLIEIAWPTLARGREVTVGGLPLALVDLPERHVLWIADAERRELVEIDAASLVVRRRLAVPHPPSAVFFDALRDEVWAVSQAGDAAFAVDVEGGAIVRRVEVRKPSAAVLDAPRRRLWIASLGDGELHRVELEAALAGRASP